MTRPIRLPDFMIIGAQKAGTTSLIDRMSVHPSLYTAPFEIHYYDVMSNFEKGPAWYARHFEAAPAGTLIGEKTPDYLWTVRNASHPVKHNIAQKIHELTPDAKLIVVLRDPVARTRSAIGHFMRRRWLSPFDKPHDLLFGEKAHRGSTFGLIEASLYMKQISEFLKYFERSQIKVYIFEDQIRENIGATLNDIYAFLGVDPRLQPSQFRRARNKAFNSRYALIANYYAPILEPGIAAIDKLLPRSELFEMEDETLHRLCDVFQEDNEALFEFLGRRVPAWDRTRSRMTQAA